MSGSIECKILVVSVNSDNVGGGEEDVSPGAKFMDDCKEFPVVDVVISFCLIEGMRYASNGSESSPIILLGEDGPCCKLRCIHFQKERSFIVRSL